MKLKGRKLSQKTKEKISKNSPKIWLDKKFTKEHREKLSKAHKGKKLSEKTKKKISAANKGKRVGKDSSTWGKYREKSGNYKGGRHKTRGYIKIIDPRLSNSIRAKYILEHRYVMENHLGRHLRKWELVHHKNGVRDDNRIQNLEIIIQKLPSFHCGKIECPYCQKEFFIK